MNRIWIGDVRRGADGSPRPGRLDDLVPEHRVRVLAVAAHVAVLTMRRATASLPAGRRRPTGGPVCGPRSPRACCASMRASAASAARTPSAAVEAERLASGRWTSPRSPLSRGLAWFWLGQARILFDDLDGAITALEQGSVDVVPGGDMSHRCRALLAGVRHLKGEHDEALAVATEVLERSYVGPRQRFVGLGPLLLAPVRARAGSWEPAPGALALPARPPRGQRRAAHAGRHDLGHRRPGRVGGPAW